MSVRFTDKALYHHRAAHAAFLAGDITTARHHEDQATRASCEICDDPAVVAGPDGTLCALHVLSTSAR